jgi:hypothetical protein
VQQDKIVDPYWGTFHKETEARILPGGMSVFTTRRFLNGQELSQEGLQALIELRIIETKLLATLGQK